VSTIAQLFGTIQTDIFLGLPACRELDDLSAKVAILGAPSITPVPVSVSLYLFLYKRSYKKRIIA
jgi:hypothetical protein